MTEKEKKELEDLPDIFIHPRELKAKHWNEIRAIAKVIQEAEKIQYFQAAILAYIEWFEIQEMNRTEH